MNKREISKNLTNCLNTTTSKRKGAYHHLKNHYEKHKQELQEAKSIKRQYGRFGCCCICRESRVVQICHIIPLSKGGSSDIENLIFLCPNHHYLFDHNKLIEPEKEKIAARLEYAQRYFELNNSTDNV